MLNEAGRQVLTEIASKGASRRYTSRSKFAHVVQALLSLGYIRRASWDRRYEITDAGTEALKR
jgi:predicted transcriptional regulator